MKTGDFHSRGKQRSTDRGAAAETCESITISSIFKFLIGPEGTEFKVHSAVVSHFSKPLAALMISSMIEGRKGEVKWEDLDENIFACICEFFYTGNYTVEDTLNYQAYVCESDIQSPSVEYVSVKEAEFESTGFELSAEKLPAERQPHDEDALWSSFATAKKARGKDSRPDETLKEAKLWHAFCNISFGSSMTCEASINDKPLTLQADILLAHARVYAFGERYDIQNLRDICLDKLLFALRDFALSDEQVTDIVALLKYAYLTTPQRDNINYDLRRLLAHYAACKIEILIQDKEFHNLLSNQYGVALEINTFLMQRID